MREKGFILAQFEGTWQLSHGAQSGSGEMRACCLVSHFYQAWGLRWDGVTHN